MDLRVDLVAPLDGLAVDIVQRCELEPHEEVASDELAGPLDLSLGLCAVLARLAQARNEFMMGNEILEQNVPDGIRRLEHPLGDDVGCVVIEDRLRPSAEISEGIKMAL